MEPKSRGSTFVSLHIRQVGRGYNRCVCRYTAHQSLPPLSHTPIETPIRQRTNWRPAIERDCPIRDASLRQLELHSPTITLIRFIPKVPCTTIILPSIITACFLSVKARSSLRQGNLALELQWMRSQTYWGVGPCLTVADALGQSTSFPWCIVHQSPTERFKICGRRSRYSLQLRIIYTSSSPFSSCQGI